MSDIYTFDSTRCYDSLTKADMSNLITKSMPAKYTDIEKYRKHMMQFFGDVRLPAVIIRGVLHAERRL